MSIIREKVLSLSEIVSGSNLVVEVEAVRSYEENVPVESVKGSQPVPDFIKKGIVFRIKNVLKNTGEEMLPEFIHVPNENWRRSLSQYKEGYANGPSKSFAVNLYETSVSSMNDAEVLFLNRSQYVFSLTAKNSFESL